MKSRIMRIGPPYYGYTLFMVEIWGSAIGWGRWGFLRRYYSSESAAQRAILRAEKGGRI